MSYFQRTQKFDGPGQKNPQAFPVGHKANDPNCHCAKCKMSAKKHVDADGNAVIDTPKPYTDVMAAGNDNKLQRPGKYESFQTVPNDTSFIAGGKQQ